MNKCELNFQMTSWIGGIKGKSDMVNCLWGEDFKDVVGQFESCTLLVEVTSL
jgi:hypothetical protein